MNRAARRALDQAASILNTAFVQSGPFPDQEATPQRLADALRQCLDVCQQLDANEAEISWEEIDELGTHALECLSDLGFWAYQLKLDDTRSAIEDLAFDMAQWIVRHGGQIAILEPVVNALARQANATQDPAALSALFDRACGIIAHVAPGFADAKEASGLQPWLTLHFNCAIIATRTQEPELMQAACDLLESHLPQHCAAFYREGAREAQKTVYGGHVRQIMQDRLTKWTTRH